MAEVHLARGIREMSGGFPQSFSRCCHVLLGASVQSKDEVHGIRGGKQVLSSFVWSLRGKETMQALNYHALTDPNQTVPLRVVCGNLN